VALSDFQPQFQPLPRIKGLGPIARLQGRFYKRHKAHKRKHKKRWTQKNN
jgi:hypothetical protein